MMPRSLEHATLDDLEGIPVLRLVDDHGDEHPFLLNIDARVDLARIGRMFDLEIQERDEVERERATRMFGPTVDTGTDLTMPDGRFLVEVDGVRKARRER